jgi:hypothetical protein
MAAVIALTESQRCLPCCCPSTPPTDLVWRAQAKNLNAGDAFDWYIDGQNRACLANALDLSIEHGVMSYALPQLFDKDSPECDPGKLGVAPAQLAPSRLPGAGAGAGAGDAFVYEAIPIPGLQNVTVPCTDYATCGGK